MLWRGKVSKMANETLGNHEITQDQLFPWNRRDLTSLVDEKGKYLGMDDLTIALATADAHIARIAAQTSPTFPVEFDDIDEDEEDDDEPVIPDATGDSTERESQ